MIWIPCTGDVCKGDVIRWTETVWPAYKPAGRFRRASTQKPLGERTITARVVSDSYGASKQQHTFTLEVIAAEGFQPPEVGTQIFRKGRNIYRNGTERQEWADETQRAVVLAEKHDRGRRARKQREVRREMEGTP